MQPKLETLMKRENYRGRDNKEKKVKKVNNKDKKITTSDTGPSLYSLCRFDHGMAVNDQYCLACLRLFEDGWISTFRRALFELLYDEELRF